jgi:hypothetical protein
MEQRADWGGGVCTVLYREKKELEREMGESVAVSAEMWRGVANVGSQHDTSNTIFLLHVLVSLLCWEIYIF